ncbi:DUF4245 domain-containing protein [Polymorphospora sp. NPDC050346]|uniref:DUF4245 domain-containing protein n=1 Tax=Polymorphospora sp. NPDC050346 TaxID=3155780 RepID=UPI0033F85A9B
MEPAQPTERGPVPPPGRTTADTDTDLLAGTDAAPAGSAGEDPDVPPPGSGEPTGKSERSPKDMAISLLVLLVPIALIFGVYRVFFGADQPVVIDPAPAVAQARASGAFEVIDPTGVDDDWRPVTANFNGADGTATLRVGFVSPEGEGVQLVQSDVPAETLLPQELTADGQPQGVIEIGGRTWQRYTARPGERALVLLEPERTVMVVGSATEAELRDLADGLG